MVLPAFSGLLACSMEACRAVRSRISHVACMWHGKFNLVGLQRHSARDGCSTNKIEVKPQLELKWKKAECELARKVAEQNKKQLLYK